MARVFVGVLLILSISLVGCTQQLARWVLSEQTQAEPVTTQDLALLTLSKQRFSLNQLNAALLQAQAESPEAKRVVVLLHGMGPYPDKAYRRDELAAVAKTYQAAVLLLHWPSWVEGTWLVLPRQTALSAGRALADFWSLLQKAPSLAQKETLLIAHSMGTEVLRGVSESPHPMVFDRLLIAAPETDAATHAAWLSRLKLAEKTWVMINADDNLLPFAQAVMQTERLGLSLPAKQAFEVEYWVLQGLSDWHTLYASRQPEALTQWLQTRLSGSVAPLPCQALSAALRFEVVQRGQVRVLCEPKSAGAS